jgi:hypothetical protein
VVVVVVGQIVLVAPFRQDAWASPCVASSVPPSSHTEIASPVASRATCGSSSWPEVTTVVGACQAPPAAWRAASSSNGSPPGSDTSQLSTASPAASTASASAVSSPPSVETVVGVVSAYRSPVGDEVAGTRPTARRRTPPASGPKATATLFPADAGPGNHELSVHPGPTPPPVTSVALNALSGWKVRAHISSQDAVGPEAFVARVSGHTDPSVLTIADRVDAAGERVHGEHPDVDPSATVLVKINGSNGVTGRLGQKMKAFAGRRDYPTRPHER